MALPAQPCRTARCSLGPERRGRLKALARSVVELQLSFLHGYRADEVKLNSKPFRFRCAVQSRWKTYRSTPRPEVSLLDG